MALTKITPQMFDTSAAGHDFNIDNGTFVVDASANRVGIGTATPSTLLHVDGTATATTFVGALTGNVTGNVSGTAATVTTAAQTNITSLGTLSALTISGDLTVDTSTLKVDSTNNRVGIGNPSPNRQLSLKHASQAEIGFKTGSVSNGALIYYNDSENQLLLRAQESGEHIAFQTGGTTERMRIGSSGQVKIANGGSLNFDAASSGNFDIAYKASDNTFNIIANSSSAAMGFHTSSTERMRIDSSGNVGIGTGNPHSSGVSFTVLNLNGTKGGSLAFSRGTNSGTKQWAIRTSDDEDLRFEYGSTLAAEAMRIDSSGNVGIGTSAPTSPLTVAKDAGGIATFTGISSGGVSSLLMKQSRGSIASPSNSSTAGDGNYMLSQVYNSGYATIGSIGIITGSALNNGEIQFNTASGGTVAERMRIAADGTATIGRTITTTYDNNQGYPLHIQAAAGNQTYLSISVPGANSGDTGLVLGHDATGTRITNREADPMIFGISSAEKMRITDAGDVSIASGGGLYFNSTRSTSTNAQAYIKESGLNLDIKGNDNVRLLGDGGNVILHADYTGQVQVQSDLLINPGSTSYRSHSNVDQYLFTVQTSYNATGTQNLNIVNHNGNWLDGTSGVDTAYGLMWGYGNSVRAGIHYDHRSVEKFDFYSTHGSIRFRVPPSANGNISPIGSETTMPTALAIAMGGYVGIGPGSLGAPTPSALLSIHGSNSQTASDAAFYVDSGGSNDWNIKTHMSAEYGFNIQSSTGLSYAFYINDNTSPYTQRFRIAGNGAAYHSGSTAVTSDERKKKNIVDMPSQWDEFKQIRWRNFEWKDGAIEGTQFGVIAQELQELNPDLIVVEPLPKEAIDDGIEDPKMLSVMYEMLHTKGMKALQEAMARIETLEAEVKALKE